MPSYSNDTQIMEVNVGSLMHGAYILFAYFLIYSLTLPKSYEWSCKLIIKSNQLWRVSRGKSCVPNIGQAQRLRKL